MNNKKLYVYHKPDAMTGHKYSDNVAIAWATSRSDAFMKFKKLYDCDIGDIEEVHFTSEEIAILTDY